MYITITSEPMPVMCIIAMATNILKAYLEALLVFKPTDKVLVFGFDKVVHRCGMGSLVPGLPTMQILTAGNEATYIGTAHLQ